MDSKTAMKMVMEYSDRCDRVTRVEKLIEAEHRNIAYAQEMIGKLQAQLARELEDRDNCHAFARSAVNALTPERGFVV